jgi:N-acetyl-gamma-glutamyl-phosphate reductase
VKVGIIGATGYTGGELLRLLVQHSKIEVTCVTSEKSAGETLVSRQPFLNRHYDLVLEKLDPEKISKKVDFVFLALSHTTAMKPVSEFLKNNVKVVDLSADYRLNSRLIYQKWYGITHLYPSLLKRSVYGLPELYRKEISKADLIANPGCFPTGALLPIIPLLKSGLVDQSREIIIDAKSGISGAGRSPGIKTHFPEANEGMMAYNIGSHRHLPEINQEIENSGKIKAQTLFTPYLLPVNRGILTTVYLPLNQKISMKRIQSIFKMYQNEPFIRLVESSPNLSQIKGTNYCDIGLFLAPSAQTAILISAIDNLVKGAAGQAIQNMNIMMEWEETLGLSNPGLFP